MKILDYTKILANTALGAGVWVWLERNADVIAAAVGCATFIWLALSIINLLTKWYREFGVRFWRNRYESKKRNKSD